MAIKINLMPDKFARGWKERFPGPSFILITSVFFVIALFIYLGIFIYQNYSLKEKIKEIETANSNLNVEISKDLKSQFISANHKAKNIKKILSSHIYWSQMYKIIESLAVNGVSYKDFLATVNKDDANIIKAEISGNATNFTTLAKQLTVFRNSKELENADFTEAELDKNGRVAFTIYLKFNTNTIKDMQYGL